LKNIPNNWKWVTLDDIGIVVGGGTPSTKEPEFWNGNIPWITPADLSNYEDVYISNGKRGISLTGLEYSSATLLPENSIVFSSRAPIGYVAITKNKLATNQGFKNLILFSNLVNSKYVYYYLKTVKVFAENMASGTTFLELSASKFKQIPFPLAPFEEQNRIVNKIEELFSDLNDAINNLDVSLQKASVYVDKTIYQLFHGNLLQNDNFKNKLPETWTWKTLSEIGDIYNGGTPSTKVKSYWGDKIPWITPSDLSNYNEKYISHGKKFITQEGLKNSSAKLIPKDSVLYSTRAPIGYVVIAKNELTTNQGFKTLVPFKEINSSYIYYFLKSIKNYANKIASGTTFLELSTEKFKQIPIPIAPIDEQNYIVGEIENALVYSSTLVKEIMSQKDNSNHTKGKILSDSFQGKLSSQVNTDITVDSLINQIIKEKESYLKAQQEIIKNFPKIKRMEKEKLSITKVLEKYQRPITSKQLWEESMYSDDIEKFYSELKKIQSTIKQEKSEKETLISIK
jgi:type I restriction enzyme, S subunit